VSILLTENYIVFYEKKIIWSDNLEPIVFSYDICMRIALLMLKWCFDDGLWKKDEMGWFACEIAWTQNTYSVEALILFYFILLLLFFFLELRGGAWPLPPRKNKPTKDLSSWKTFTLYSKMNEVIPTSSFSY
jgi:hypothetical protein